MKLNLDYYKEELEYNKYENEEIIISEYLEKYQHDDYSEIINQDASVDEIKALSGIRKNIISWYPFKENSTILEIGAGLGEITGELCKKAGSVISIEFSKKRGEAIAKRHKDKKNLEVIIGNLQDIQLQEKFDYIILIDILGYAKNINLTPEKIIQFAKSKIKDNGIILLADENRLGMQYWTRISENGESIVKHNKQLFTIKEIDELLKQCDLVKYKLYYVQPDIKLANVIYTEQYLPDEENLTRNIVYGKKEDIEFYSQNEAYKEILKDKDLFPIFVNAFFLEIFNNEISNNDIKMVSFSNMRKPEYRIKTVIKGNKVYKSNENNKSKKHIEQIKRNIDIINNSGLNTLDTYSENEIISEFSTEKTLDKVIVELMEQGNEEDAIKLINDFKHELLTRFEVGSKENNVFNKYKIMYNEDDIEDLNFVKYGLWDLIFQNCFYYNDNFYFYDQEWMEENVPLEFILYRAILYFGKLKKYISDKDMYNKLGIKENHIELFNKLDNSIQDRIRGNSMWSIHNQMQKVLELKERMLTIQHERNILSIENKEKEKELDFLRKVNEKQKIELDAIKNSKTWRITNSIRILINKKGENNENKR